jgi:arylsulfatase A
MFFLSLKRVLVHRVAMVIFGGLLALVSGAADRPMNVVFLLVDDWGWTDGGVFGSDLYETPNIDKLADGAVRFTQAYAACTVCSPTRAAVMTGQYPARLRVTDWIAGHTSRYQNIPLAEPDWTQRLEFSQTTLAEVLRARGYHTANVGKWHLTPDAPAGSPEEMAYWPEHHGFDVNVAGNRWGQPGKYFAPFSRPGLMMPNMPEAKEGAYLTDVLTDEVVKLIGNWKADPFFIYLPYYTVHTPIQAKAELIEKYTAKVKADGRHRNPAYAAMVQSLDESVGRIWAALEAAGVADNTLIILTGDNGGLDPEDEGSITNNAPLRNGKGSVYEGGVRVPGVIKYPGGRSGVVETTPIISMDYYPTILSALKVPTPEVPLDGVDLTPLLKKGASSLPQRDLFWHYPHYHTEGATPYSAIRSGDFRLVEYHLDGGVELYNLAEDIGETHDLVNEMPGKALALMQKLTAWRVSVDAQMPYANPGYDSSQPSLSPRGGPLVR